MSILSLGLLLNGINIAFVKVINVIKNVIKQFIIATFFTILLFYYFILFYFIYNSKAFLSIYRLAMTELQIVYLFNQPKKRRVILQRGSRYRMLNTTKI